MSFMFKPLEYDDLQAVNHIKLPAEVTGDILTDTEDIAGVVAKSCLCSPNYTLAIDGYVSAQFSALVNEIKKQVEARGAICRCIDMKTLYKSEEEIDILTKENLPLNYEEDPVLLFGKLYKGDIDDFIDMEKAVVLEEKNCNVTILYGLGSLAPCLRFWVDGSAYIDVTPKTAAIRGREKKFVNIGDQEVRPFPLLMRRNYFVDFEVVIKLRKELLQNGRIDFYLLGNQEDQYIMMERTLMDSIFATLAQYPFRAKPVYLEGIWGGEFIRKVRTIPKEIAGNVAWIFDFIPMEVSIVAEVGGRFLDFPFSTFVQKSGLEIMGKRCVDEFEGYFPIRFNYDDTWHSNGNMSIQVHPDEDFVIDHYDEFGRQDEAYYVIATGHGAKTYCGFKGDGKEFLKLAEASEKDHREIDYQKYIYSLDSMPGKQIMLPAGTIHASGRNQLILELGSLTIGSYTYKVYDYNRKDKDQNVRPIHTKNAEQVLHFERDAQWVNENVAMEPVLLEETEAYREYLVGKTDLMYYETHRIEIQTGQSYIGNNNGQFTVVAVVDGEQVRIHTKDNEAVSYTAGFLDIVTIPASIENYVIEAQGYQPVVIHKTILREGYSRYKNPAYMHRKED